MIFTCYGYYVYIIDIMTLLIINFKGVSATPDRSNKQKNDP